MHGQIFTLTIYYISRINSFRVAEANGQGPIETIWL